MLASNWRDGIIVWWINY